MRQLSLLGFTLLLTSAAPALADAIPPDVTACEGSSAGDACTSDGQSGTCVADTCSRLDYSVDASGMPGTMQYDCVRCDVAGGESGGGCSASAMRAELGVAGVAFALVLAGLVLRRRSR